MEWEPLKGNEAVWDAFVERHPEGRVCHFLGYRTLIAQTFGYEPRYYCLKRDGELIGVFPSFRTRTLLRRPKLISQPFIEYGGLLANGLDTSELVSFRDKVLDILREENLPFLEIHGGQGVPAQQLSAICSTVCLYEYAVLPLSSSQEMWNHVISRHVRKAVRKAEKAGLECVLDASPQAMSRDFYPLYLRSMKRLGSPPFSLAFFLNKLHYLKENTVLFVVRDRGRCVAALLGFVGSRRVHIVFSVSDPESWEKRPNDLVHWRFIQWSCEQGNRWFDFGTVRYASQKQFKEKWGVEFQPYCHYFILNPTQAHIALPTGALSPKMQLLSRAWARFVPAPLARILGPKLHQYLAM